MTDPVMSILQDLRRMGQTTLDTAWQAIRLVDWLRAPEPCGRIPPTDSKTLNHLLAQAVAGIVQRTALTKENAILNELISRCGVEEMTEMRFTKKPPAEGQSWFLIVDRWRGLYVYHYSPASAATAKAKFHIKAAIIPHADSRGWRVAFDSDGKLVVGYGNSLQNGSTGDSSGPAGLLKVDLPKASSPATVGSAR